MEYRRFVEARDVSELTTTYVSTDEILCKEYDYLYLLFYYRRKNASGALKYKIEYSLDNVTWYQSTIYEGGAVTSGSDTESEVQREEFVYGGTGVPAETFVHGPIEINQSANYLRVAVLEDSQGDEGDCGLDVVLTRRKQEVFN